MNPDVGYPVSGTAQRSSEFAARSTRTAWLPACTTAVCTFAVLVPGVFNHVPFTVAGV